MPSVLIAGGGLAGLAAAAALGSAGFEVDLHEARPFLGGRATSYHLPGEHAESGEIDNCQHVLLRCCVNLIDFYTRLGVSDRLQFERRFYFVEPGGRVSELASGRFPAPLHFTESFLRLRFLSWQDKLALGRAMLSLRTEWRTRRDLDSISMLDWLREKHQPAAVIERFWRQVLVSAINEELDRMAARHAFQVFWLGFLATADSYEMGVPSVPLGELYGADAWARFANVRIHFKSTVEKLSGREAVVGGTARQADLYIAALPFERLGGVIDGFDPPAFEHSPITGIHLWFDRRVTELPHATLLDRTIQWMFNKGEGRYLQLVVSASRSLVRLSREQVLELALAELKEFFPAVGSAELVRAHVVKEVRATFSAAPGITRPGVATVHPNVFVAGDWTESGWPATMEGAVRSGYIAAEAAARACGRSERFLLPDIA